MDEKKERIALNCSVQSKNFVFLFFVFGYNPHESSKDRPD